MSPTRWRCSPPPPLPTSPGRPCPSPAGSPWLEPDVGAGRTVPSAGRRRQRLDAADGACWSARWRHLRLPAGEVLAQLGEQLIVRGRRAGVLLGSEAVSE